MFRFDRYGHSFLRLGHPYLPLIQTLILERDLVEIDPATVAETGGLADGGRKTSSAVVGDVGHETFVPCLQQEVVHFFLGVGVADLHVAGRRVLREYF
jgi:hypothetical protein